MDMRPIFKKNNPLTIAALLCTGIAAALPMCGFASGLPQTNVPDGCGISFHETSLSSTELSLMQNSGFKVARIDLPWTSIEYSAGLYNFSSYDALVAQLTSIGVRPLLILDTNSPYYGSGAGPYNTTEQQGFANFAAAAAAHYASSNVIWEIWNEPNLTTWQPTSDPTYWRWTDNTNTYISLLKVTVPAMLAANSNAVILGGVTSGVPQDYIEALLNSGALTGVSALSVHPYLSTNPEVVTAEYDATRALIARYTPIGQTPLPIFSSEWGYSTTNVSQQCQAAYLLRTYLVDLASGVNTSVFYDFVDNGTDSDPTNPNPENHYGVVTTADAAKPSYTAVQNFTTALNGYRFCHRMVGSSALDYKLLFAGPSDVAIVEWTADDPTTDPNPPLPTITKIEPGNSSYSQLQLASCIQFAPDTLVATTGQPALSITVNNPFSTAASVVVSNFSVNHTITAAANGAATQSITLTPSTSPGIQQLDLNFTWNGTSVTGIMPPNATSASVFPVTTCPSGANLMAYVTNTSQTAFSGNIVYQMNGSSVLTSQSQSLTLAVGQSASVTFSGCYAQAGTVQVVSSAGLVWGHANTEIDYSDTNWPANAAEASPYNYQEYLNYVAQTPVTANVVTDSTAPNGYGIQMPYAAELYNELDTLAPISTDNIPLGATSMKVWVLSDGSGVIYKGDFEDATGQSFTASGGNLDYPGWQLITLALDGSGGPFWGGANDGVPHGQCYWTNWAMADGHGGYIPTHTGTLEFASPFYGYYSFGYGQHSLINVNSNQAIVVSGGSTSPGATLIQYSANGTANGYWKLIPVGNGTYHIVNVNSGEMINIPGASTTPGTQLIQYTNDGNANSEWTLQPIGNGKYNIVSAYDGQYIEVTGSSTALGAAVDQANPTGAANQQWYVY